MWCGYRKLGDNLYLTMFVGSSLMPWFLFSRSDVALGLWMLTIRIELLIVYFALLRKAVNLKMAHN